MSVWQPAANRAIADAQMALSATSPDAAWCEDCDQLIAAAANMGWYAGWYLCASCRGKLMGYANHELGLDG